MSLALGGELGLLVACLGESLFVLDECVTGCSQVGLFLTQGIELSLAFGGESGLFVAGLSQGLLVLGECVAGCDKGGLFLLQSSELLLAVVLLLQQLLAQCGDFGMQALALHAGGVALQQQPALRVDGVRVFLQAVEADFLQPAGDGFGAGIVFVERLAGAAYDQPGEGLQGFGRYGLQQFQCLAGSLYLQQVRCLCIQLRFVQQLADAACWYCQRFQRTQVGVVLLERSRCVEAAVSRVVE